MTAPTEAEIRSLIDDRVSRFPRDSGYGVLDDAIDFAFDVVGYTDLDEDGRHDFGTNALSDLWADLTPEQVSELRELIQEGKARAFNAAWDVIAGQIVRTALAFTYQYPDAGRAPRRPEPVPA